MLTMYEEYREVFREPPLVAFRRCKNLKDITALARLYSFGDDGSDNKGCSRCGKSRCQVYKYILYGPKYPGWTFLAFLPKKALIGFCR